jgi:hypothetical protein
MSSYQGSGQKTSRQVTLPEKRRRTTKAPGETQSEVLQERLCPSHKNEGKPISFHPRDARFYILVGPWLQKQALTGGKLDLGIYPALKSSLPAVPNSNEPQAAFLVCLLPLLPFRAQVRIKYLKRRRDAS